MESNAALQSKTWIIQVSPIQSNSRPPSIISVSEQFHAPTSTYPESCLTFLTLILNTLTR